MVMSFIVPSCALLLALFVGIALDDIGIRRWQRARRKLRCLDTW
jgi:hypothetical protein